MSDERSIDDAFTSIGAKQFAASIVFSVLIHFLALNAFLSLKHDEDSTQYTELKIKLGADIVDLTHNKPLPMPVAKPPQDVAGTAPIDQPAMDTASNAPLPVETQSQDAATPLGTALDEAQTDQPPEPAQHTPEQSSTLLDVQENAQPDANPQTASLENVEIPHNQQQREIAARKFQQLSAEQLAALAPAAGSETNVGERVGNSEDEDAVRLTRYEQMLPLWINQFRIYPEEAKAQGLQGRGDVLITIDRKGRVLQSKIIRSTNQPVLDDALIKMVSEASPVIPVPPNYHTDRNTFSYKISFEFVL